MSRTTVTEESLSLLKNLPKLKLIDVIGDTITMDILMKLTKMNYHWEVRNGNRTVPVER